MGETYARMAARAGARLAPNVLDAAFREAFPAMPAMAFPGRAGEELAAAERAWWRDLVARVVRRAGRIDAFDAFFDALFSHFAEGSAWRTYPETRGVLESLRRRGIRVAVVSNFDSRLPSILYELELAPLLDAVVYSTGCGAAKPDPEIFHHALAVLEADPESAMHVGDTVAADFRGAQAAGMCAVHLHRRGAPPHGVAPVVRQLDELEALIESRT